TRNQTHIPVLDQSDNEVQLVHRDSVDFSEPERVGQLAQVRGKRRSGFMLGSLGIYAASLSLLTIGSLLAHGDITRTSDEMRIFGGPAFIMLGLGAFAGATVMLGIGANRSAREVPVLGLDEELGINSPVLTQAFKLYENRKYKEAIY